MPVWSTDTGAMPEGVPVLLRLVDAPIGWAVPNKGSRATVVLGQRGEAGVWTAEGFWSDRPKKHTLGSEVFTAWAHIPPFDGEVAP